MSILADKRYALSAFCFLSGKFEEMLGLGDLSIFLAMIGSVAVTAVCVVYGIVNWNRGDEDQK